MKREPLTTERVSRPACRAPGALWRGFGGVAALAFVACVADTGDLFADVGGAAPAPGATGASDIGAAASGGGSGASEVGPAAPSQRSPSPPAPAPPSAGGAPNAPAAPTAPPTEVAAVLPPPDPTGGARVCQDVAQPLLLDFDVVNNGPSQALFGDFQSVLSGGTFIYPERSSAPGAGVEALGLVSDVTAGDWHVAGVVEGAAGFGLFFECERFDASRFAGIAFQMQGSIQGNAVPGDAGQAGAEFADSVVFFIGSAANEVSRRWLLDVGSGSVEPSFGRCTPADTQFDGSCQAPRVTLPVTPEAAEVVIPFADLTDGSPELGLNPAEITTIQWLLPPQLDADGAVVPVAVDLRIDQIRFLEAE